jgi:hypothetical protein
MTETVASQGTGPHAYSLRISLTLMFSEDPEQVDSPGQDALIPGQAAIPMDRPPAILNLSQYQQPFF